MIINNRVFAQLTRTRGDDRALDALSNRYKLSASQQRRISTRPRGVLVLLLLGQPEIILAASCGQVAQTERLFSAAAAAVEEELQRSSFRDDGSAIHVHGLAHLGW